MERLREEAMVWWLGFQRKLFIGLGNLVGAAFCVGLGWGREE